MIALARVAAGEPLSKVAPDYQMRRMRRGVEQVKPLSRKKLAALAGS